MHTQPQYLIWQEPTDPSTSSGRSPTHNAHIARPDGRADTLTGNSLTLEQAIANLQKAGVTWQVVVDTIYSGNGRD